MPIRRAAQARTKKGTVRHPALRPGTYTFMVYNFIKSNPGVASFEVREALNMPHPQAMARVTELKNLGLITETGQYKSSSSGRPVACLAAVTQNETGHGRVRVSIELSIYINENNKYAVRANIIGGDDSVDFAARKVYSKLMNVHVPTIFEPAITNPLIHGSEDINTASKLISNPKGPVIKDVEYEEIA